MSPDLQVCQKKLDCDNNGFLIVDTNFIIYLIDGICGMVEEELNGSSRDIKFTKFCDVFDSILSSIRPCSLDETLWTSDIVYSKEMSPTDRLSTLRNESPRFNTMCCQNEHSIKRICKKN